MTRSKKNGNKGIGNSLIRPDGKEKVMGSFEYSSDLYHEDMLWGATLRSPHPSAKIVNIDTSEAEIVDGVVAVLTSKDLPGKPDIVLKKHNTVIFVNGCFWHQHKGCKRANVPKSNKVYWVDKIEKNKARDKLNISKLKKLKWKIFVVWECETKNIEKLGNRLKKIRH